MNDHGGLLAAHQAGVVGARASSQRSRWRSPKDPQVALSGYWSRGNLGQLVGRIGLGVHQISIQAVDFSRIKAGQREVEIFCGRRADSSCSSAARAGRS